jgi:hypothetical protein
MCWLDPRNRRASAGIGDAGNSRPGPRRIIFLLFVEPLAEFRIADASRGDCLDECRQRVRVSAARAGVPASRRRDGITRAPGAVVRHGTGVAPTGARLRAQRVARDRHNRLLMPGVFVFSSDVSVVGPRAKQEARQLTQNHSSWLGSECNIPLGVRGLCRPGTLEATCQP